MSCVVVAEYSSGGGVFRRDHEGGVDRLLLTGSKRGSPSLQAI